MKHLLLTGVACAFVTFGCRTPAPNAVARTPTGDGQPAPRTPRASMPFEKNPVENASIGPSSMTTAYRTPAPGVGLWHYTDRGEAVATSFTPLDSLFGGPGAMALAPKEDTLAVAARAGGMIVQLELNSGTWQPTSQRVGPSARVSSLAFAPNGVTLAASGEDVGEGPSDDAPSAKAVSYSSPGFALVWSTPATQTPLRLAGGDGRLADIAFTQNGTHLVGLYEDGTCISWSLREAAEVGRVRFAGRGHALSAASNGQLALAATSHGTEGFTLHVVDEASLSKVASMTGDSSWPSRIGWSDDSRSVVVTAVDAVQVFDIQSGKRIKRMDYRPGRRGPNPRASAFVRAGLLVAGGDAQAWTLWKIHKRRPLAVGGKR